MKRKNFLRISCVARLAAVAAALMQTAEAVPYSVHFEERGHLNEVREDAGPVTIGIVREGPLTSGATMPTLATKWTSHGTDPSWLRV